MRKRSANRLRDAGCFRDTHRRGSAPIGPASRERQGCLLAEQSDNPMMTGAGVKIAVRHLARPRFQGLIQQRPLEFCTDPQGYPENRRPKYLERVPSRGPPGRLWPSKDPSPDRGPPERVPRRVSSGLFAGDCRRGLFGPHRRAIRSIRRLGAGRKFRTEPNRSRSGLLNCRSAVPD